MQNAGVSSEFVWSLPPRVGKVTTDLIHSNVRLLFQGAELMTFNPGRFLSANVPGRKEEDRNED